MAARAILVPKVNSHPFDDRVLLLEVPCKVGRAHKDDQADSANGLFDCKVLSRQHAMIIYEDDRFYILDTGSSNGTFVNNIRLSKTGEESKMTEIFTGDIIRFGSDIVDKNMLATVVPPPRVRSRSRSENSRNNSLRRSRSLGRATSRQITQKCIVTKIKLYDSDGNLGASRPPESRLFRPTDSFEDLSTMTLSLQEALAREKMLEDKLITVKSMISKNIGKSHTDLMRLFEDVKEELINLYDQREAIINSTKDDTAIEKLGAENHNLKKDVKQLEQDLSIKDEEIDILQKKTQADSVELMTLRRACELQKDDLYKLELKLERTLELVELSKRDAMESRNEAMKEFQVKLSERESEVEREKKDMESRYQEVVVLNRDLLNRIKSLENEEGYGRAEIDKAMAKEREVTEHNQHLQYRVECLENELQDALQMIEQQKSQVKVVRDEKDLAKIAEQEESINSLQSELAYVKKELIEARAHKSASDDKLSTVQDKIETMQNNINSLSDEGARLKKIITGLEETLANKTQEAQHLSDLVAKMESSSSSDEMNKVQIADLKTELSKAEEALRIRTEELLETKKELRVKDEEIQQREIDISCLKGQSTNLQDEFDILKAKSENALTVMGEVEDLRQRLVLMEDNLNVSVGENERLVDELSKQQALYNELKKMRGQGEAMDMLQQLEQESRESQRQIVSLEQELGNQSQQIESLTEEKLRLLREVAHTRAALNSGRPLSASDELDQGSEGYYYTSPTVSTPLANASKSKSSGAPISGDQLVPKISSSGNTTISNVGALRLYEFMLGIFFIAAMLNYIFV